MCVDTLKRILVREGLRDFEGAKYVVARKVTVAMWERPCMDCKSTELRPKKLVLLQEVPIRQRL